jgi:DNA-binding response OmpR family regulator
VRLLVVTPFTAERLALQGLLAAEGHVVETAATCDVGLARAVVDRPDVVIAHAQLAEHDGHAWLEHLRAHRLRARLILLCPRARCRCDPDVVCLTKPIDLAQLRRMLATPAALSAVS